MQPPRALRRICPGVFLCQTTRHRDNRAERTHRGPTQVHPFNNHNHNHKHRHNPLSAQPLQGLLHQNTAQALSYLNKATLLAQTLNPRNGKGTLSAKTPSLLGNGPLLPTSSLPFAVPEVHRRRGDSRLMLNTGIYGRVTRNRRERVRRRRFFSGTVSEVGRAVEWEGRLGRFCSQGMRRGRRSGSY